jgi:hypothetical protein
LYQFAFYNGPVEKRRKINNPIKKASKMRKGGAIRKETSCRVACTTMNENQAASNVK